MDSLRNQIRGLDVEVYSPKTTACVKVVARIEQTTRFGGNRGASKRRAATSEPEGM